MLSILMYPSLNQGLPTTQRTPQLSAFTKFLVQPRMDFLSHVLATTSGNLRGLYDFFFEEIPEVDEVMRNIMMAFMQWIVQNTLFAAKMVATLLQGETEPAMRGVLLHQYAWCRDIHSDAICLIACITRDRSIEDVFLDGNGDEYHVCLDQAGIAVEDYEANEVLASPPGKSIDEEMMFDSDIDSITPRVDLDTDSNSDSIPGPEGYDPTRHFFAVGTAPRRQYPAQSTTSQAIRGYQAEIEDFSSTEPEECVDTTTQLSREAALSSPALEPVSRD
ncbi:hypothetical protein F5Y15DRAFT_288152 [Xylariaceae sp. FL0016]|nr:hypothetical protein F5Y15DRAFT_288152 [Xylariaceae sp. FL0016]